LGLMTVAPFFTARREPRRPGATVDRGDHASVVGRSSIPCVEASSIHAIVAGGNGVIISSSCLRRRCSGRAMPNSYPGSWGATSPPYSSVARGSLSHGRGPDEIHDRLTRLSTPLEDWRGRAWLTVHHGQMRDPARHHVGVRRKPPFVDTATGSAPSGVRSVCRPGPRQPVCRPSRSGPRVSGQSSLCSGSAAPRQRWRGCTLEELATEMADNACCRRNGQIRRGCALRRSDER